MTREKIRESFRKAASNHKGLLYEDFRSGYIALLNELEPSYLFCGNGMLYHLPKGVTK